MHTNINGIIPRKLELADYLKEKTENVCLAETKLTETIQINIENNNYNLWRKARKGKIWGVMLMVKSWMQVINVQYG